LRGRRSPTSRSANSLSEFAAERRRQPSWMPARGTSTHRSSRCRRSAEGRQQLHRRPGQGPRGGPRRNRGRFPPRRAVWWAPWWVPAYPIATLRCIRNPCAVAAPWSALGWLTRTPGESRRSWIGSSRLIRRCEGGALPAQRDRDRAHAPRGRTGLVALTKPRARPYQDSRKPMASCFSFGTSGTPCRRTPGSRRRRRAQQRPLAANANRAH
jgi:hypothetical protein